MTPRAERTAPDAPPGAPAATRHRVLGWRDPRLVAGVLVVALSVLGGSVLFAHADDTEVVWGVRRTVPVGAALTEADLESRRIGLGSGALRSYLPVSGDDPVGRVLDRPVEAGELLPAGALAVDGGEAGVRVPLEVAPTDLPPSVRAGASVDVWVTERAEAGATSGRRADRAFTEVRVVAISRDRDQLGPRAVRSVVVLVPPADEQELGALIGAAASGRVILTEAQGGAR